MHHRSLVSSPLPAISASSHVLLRTAMCFRLRCNFAFIPLHICATSANENVHVVRGRLASGLEACHPNSRGDCRISHAGLRHDPSSVLEGRNLLTPGDQRQLAAVMSCHARQSASTCRASICRRQVMVHSGLPRTGYGMEHHPTHISYVVSRRTPCRLCVRFSSRTNLHTAAAAPLLTLYYTSPCSYRR